MTTVHDWLAAHTKELAAAGIETARLDCLILLEDVLGHNRAHILAHDDTPLTHTQLTNLNTLITQRQKNVPLAYIRGHAAFYGRTFVVTPDVLVPRPETEAIIELVKDLAADYLPPVHISDIGCGSGCIGITLALELPQAVITLSDISSKALAVARQNAHRLGVMNVIFTEGNLLASIASSNSVIVANLPYVPNEYPVNDAARHEPALALFSGKDGLDLYCRFWKELGDLRVQPATVLTESLEGQHQEMINLAQKNGYRLVVSRGLVQQFSNEH